MIAWGRLVYGTGALAISLGAGYFGATWLKDNKDALGSILSFFSVLAGFLVAVIALVADERNLRGATWRAKHFNAKTMRKRLLRHRMLFSIYLTACFLAFVDSLKIRLPPQPQAWLDGTTLGVTVFAFLVSFSLPHNLSSEYLRRLDQAIADARKPPAQRTQAPAETSLDRNE